MTPEKLSGIAKSVEDILLAAVMAEVLKQPEVVEGMKDVARKFVPAMLQGIAKMKAGGAQ